MVNVTLSADVTDDCGGDPSPLTTIISVSSNEPAGSDAVANGQAVITGDLALKLKAERNGNGNGRIYTITVQTTDSYGNIATGTVDVTVPHDQNHSTCKCASINRGHDGIFWNCVKHDQHTKRKELLMSCRH
jgi:hypothetical protein